MGALKVQTRGEPAKLYSIQAELWIFRPFGTNVASRLTDLLQIFMLIGLAVVDNPRSVPDLLARGGRSAEVSPGRQLTLDCPANVVQGDRGGYPHPRISAPEE
jgi:hypothetical protein